MYYRRFISGFANTAKQLTKFTEENQPFDWTPEAEAAFETLTGALCTALFLHTQSQQGGSSLRQTQVTSG
jgi:hypothetical protein